MSIRIIARLDIKGPNLVKGIHLEGLRVLGKPERFAQTYYREGIDELLYMDVVASLYQRNSLLDMVNRTARDVFIPLTVGGGLRTLEDIRNVLTAGADKVSLNTAVIARPELIREAAQKFGSSTIVISLEAIRMPNGHYEVYTDNGRESTGVDAFEWAVRAADLGAGELLVTSIDREGTGKGFDLDLTKRVADAVSIPVVACGGAGTIAHVCEAVLEGHADAVCVASLLHYDYLNRYGSEHNATGEGNVEYLKQPRGFTKIAAASVRDLKAEMSRRAIPCRPPAERPVNV
jgi:cyclase